MHIKIIIASIIFFFSSCGSGDPDLPKPRAYPRVDYPTKTYQYFNRDDCPMTFKYPIYADIIKDEMFFDQSLEDACWFDISIKSLNGRIHCSYYALQSRKQFDKLIDDAFKLAGKHTVKADYIDDVFIENNQGATGFIFGLTGPVASPYQFFLTDSTHHFMRGALYFNAKSNPDSLEPIIDFVKQDMDVLIESFAWK